MKKDRINAFTLIELLVVVAIIGLLALIILARLNDTREKAKVAKALQDSRSLKTAAELYFDQMGFYPPDANRGWDPGFTKPLPYNYDTGITDTSFPCPNCPTDWVNIVQAKWNGPYIGFWPKLTPWNGKYDFNVWPSGNSRYGCDVPAGVYVGVQRDYSDNNPISYFAETIMIDQNYEAEHCRNGESQLMLIKL
jgi:prepilin-type N-terminal cleavage/methylation domain-containing protein